MFDTIASYFRENLPYITVFGTEVNLLSQIAGFLGFFLIMFAYQQKKLTFLIISGVSYIVFMAEGFFLLGESNTLSNVVGNGTSFLRNMAMIFCLVKYKKDLPTWASLPFLAIYWIGAIPTLDVWYSYIPPIATTVYTLSAIQKNYYVLKAGALFLEGIFLIYHPITGAYVGGIRQAVLVVAISISIIRMYRADKATAAVTEPPAVVKEPQVAEPTSAPDASASETDASQPITE